METLEKELKVSDIFGCGGVLSNANTFVAGLECEIEAIPDGKRKSFGIFSCKEDGSLRNNGWEYVSTPESRETLVKQFSGLQDWLNLDEKKNPFSHRTSTHVHVNVSSMSEKHAKNMLLLYALYEEFFFSMVKPERRTNIHCVPNTETHLPNYYGRPLSFLQSKWSKYSAVNLCRLADLGTFEFRHMHGTGDVQEIATWLHVLENLWKLSQQVVIDAESLQDQHRLFSWFSTIFNPSYKTMMLGGQLLNIIQNSLIDVKFSTIKE
jgi:hypothetical protein